MANNKEKTNAELGKQVNEHLTKLGIHTPTIEVNLTPDQQIEKLTGIFEDALDVLGLDREDKYAQDDIIVQELRLPVGRKVVFKMRSQDVLHSAYMPHFRMQMN